MEQHAAERRVEQASARCAALVDEIEFCSFRLRPNFQQVSRLCASKILRESSVSIKFTTFLFAGVLCLVSVILKRLALYRLLNKPCLVATMANPPTYLKEALRRSHRVTIRAEAANERRR
jgi:hypothetical protein